MGCFNDQTDAPSFASAGNYSVTQLTQDTAGTCDPSQCLQNAVSLGHPVFAVQACTCYTMNNQAPANHYSKYNASKVCPTNGLGASLINNVYWVNASQFPQRSGMTSILYSMLK